MKAPSSDHFPPARMGMAAAMPGWRRFCVMVVGMTCGMLPVGCKQFGGMSDSMSGTEPGEERVFGIGHGVELEFRWAPAENRAREGSHGDRGGGGSGQTTVPIIDDGFWIAARETAALTWRSVMRRESPMTNNTAKTPGTYASWLECREFLTHLESPAKGWKFELPTEAQWEYACRGGSSPACGRNVKQGWIVVDSVKRKNPTRMNPSNAWSIRDIQGNIAEWCRDSDPETLTAGSNSAARFLRVNRVGFRLVLVREESLESKPAPPVARIDTPNTP